MARPRHYVPCISKSVVSALYHEAKRRQKPMTVLVDELLTDGRGTRSWQLAHAHGDTEANRPATSTIKYV